MSAGRPRAPRIPMAFLAAGVTAGAAPAMVSFNPLLAIFSIPIALLHVLVLAVPAYLALSVRHPLTLARTLAASFLIGALPLGALLLALSVPETTSAWSNGIPTLINGVRTWYGWIETVLAAFTFGIFGMCGGFVFWEMLRDS